MSKQIKCCIAGVNGYVGEILLKLVVNHPNLNLSAVLAKDSRPVAKDVPVYSLQELMEKTENIDVILLATPAEVSIEIVTALNQRNITIIDLSGAFRLPVVQLEKWYGLSHQLTDFQNGAFYGLSPFFQTHSGQTTLIANPGCYATGVLLTLMPLLQNNIIETDSIIVDAKSGVSGAGKKVNADLMFCEINENFMPYKIGQHQHLPEIKQCLFELTGHQCQMTLVTQLLPVKSGIAMSIYCQANQKWVGDGLTARVISEVFEHAYKDYPLLEFSQLNQGNSYQEKYLLSLSSIVGTPNTHVSFHIDNGNICLFTCLDNLWKGAASQAIENINTLYQLPVDAGLQFYKGGL